MSFRLSPRTVRPQRSGVDDEGGDRVDRVGRDHHERVGSHEPQIGQQAGEESRVAGHHGGAVRAGRRRERSGHDHDVSLRERLGGPDAHSRACPESAKVLQIHQLRLHGVRIDVDEDEVARRSRGQPVEGEGRPHRSRTADDGDQRAVTVTRSNHGWPPFRER